MLVTVGMVAAENISQIISLLSKSGYVEPTAVGAALKASYLDQSVKGLYPLGNFKNMILFFESIYQMNIY